MLFKAILSCDKNAKNMNQLILKAKSTVIRASKSRIKKTDFDLNRSHHFSDKRLESIFLKWNQILKDRIMIKFRN